MSSTLPLRVTWRLDPAERAHFKPLAREVLKLVGEVEAGTASHTSGLRARCIAEGYVWGDLFLHSVSLIARFKKRGELKSLARAQELRADLRAFVTDDACLDDHDLSERKTT
jgi:hypothetical protein